MNKNVALDALAYFCFCALAGTGLLLECRLCEDASGTILGIAAEDWRDIHEWVAYLFIALVVLHLVLHGAWIRKLATTHCWPTVLGFAAGLGLIAGLLLAPARHSAQWRHDREAEHAREHDD